MLCFSPVGATLRVRSRKFPAVTNCTSIDWFHEWPEEALISVSGRFLSEGTELSVCSYIFLHFAIYRTCIKADLIFSYTIFDITIIITESYFHKTVFSQ